MSKGPKTNLLNYLTAYINPVILAETLQNSSTSKISVQRQQGLCTERYKVGTTKLAAFQPLDPIACN